MMISTCLKQLNKPEEFRQTMTDLARRHCEKGIHANEYGVVGDVLFYTLQHCLDEDVYDRETELAWIRIYSAMLRAILPTALQYEETGNFDVSSRTFSHLRVNGSSNYQNRLSVVEPIRSCPDNGETESFYDDVGMDSLPQGQLHVVVEPSSERSLESSTSVDTTE
jgi:hypothetical protein